MNSINKEENTQIAEQIRVKGEYDGRMHLLCAPFTFF